MRPVISIALVAVLTACAGEETNPPPTTTPTSAELFTFAPTAGVKYVRVARWTRELSIVGTDLRRVETLAFTWNGVFSAADQNIFRDEDLAKIDVSINAKKVAVLVPKNPIKIRLTLLRNGHVQDIEGVQTLASALVSLLPPDEQTAGTKAAFGNAIEDTVTSLQETVSQDIAGNPVKIGWEWDSNRSNEKRHFTVAGMEKCSLGTCARITANVVSLFPKVAGVQEEIADLRGKPVGKVRDANLTLRMSGVFDPHTLMVTQSNVTQTATFVFETDGGAVTIQLKGQRDVEWRY